jgi:hypothetical protein
MLDWHDLSCRSGQDAVQLCFPLMFMFEQKLSQVPPVPQDHGVMPLPREMPLCLMLLLHVINALEVEGAGVSPSQLTSLPGPSFMHVLSSVCCLFYISCSPQLDF